MRESARALTLNLTLIKEDPEDVFNMVISEIKAKANKAGKKGYGGGLNLKAGLAHHLIQP